MSLAVETTLPKISQKPKTERLIEELSRTEGKAEIINGEIVKMPSCGFVPHRAGAKIFISLFQYETETKLGYALSDGIGILVNLPHRKSFTPDASFFIGKPSGMKFLKGAPIFAVEVRSENDYGAKAEREIAEKRADYFAAGTEIVWDVDLQSNDAIKSYHRDNPNMPRIFRRGDIADAEPALPNWKINIEELFE